MSNVTTTAESTAPAISTNHPNTANAAVKEPEPSDESETSVPTIKYTYKCNNTDGGTFTETYNIPLDLKVEGKPVEEKSCILEIVTEVDVQNHHKLDDSLQKSDSKLASLKVLGLQSSQMVIYSPLLLQAIREVVKYYPR